MGTINKIDLIKELNIDKDLELIWSKRYDNENIIAGIFSNELYTNAITFLSLNPSLLPRDIATAKRGFYPSTPYPIVDWQRENAEYKFFKKFYSLGEKLGPWTVLDLLYERDSDQSTLERKYKKQTILEQDKDFLLGQIKLTFKILNAIKPKLVVVSNSFANNLIHDNMNDLKLDQELPSNENNFIYKIDNIPFITNESKFLGSRYLEKKSDRLNILTSEIERILKYI